jgi:hypothetical protein
LGGSLLVFRNASLFREEIEERIDELRLPVGIDIDNVFGPCGYAVASEGCRGKQAAASKIHRGSPDDCLNRLARSCCAKLKTPFRKIDRQNVNL